MDSNQIRSILVCSVRQISRSGTYIPTIYTQDITLKLAIQLWNLFYSIEAFFNVMRMYGLIAFWATC